MLRLLLVVALVLGGLVALLVLFQDRLLYFPRRYPIGPDAVPAPFTVLRFRTEAGTQHAVWRAPDRSTPTRIWVLFGGNGMTALDWLGWLDGHPELDAGFLMIDYPGYGWSDGAPSPESISVASAAALASLREHLGTELPAVCVLGHSLGAAVALRFASETPVRCVLLSAPFTRLSDVAAHHYGPWIRPLVRSGFDNHARLEGLAAPRPAVLVVHGTADEVIPLAHGQELAQRHPWVGFHPVPGARHNDLLDRARTDLHHWMRELGR